jgi:hypothetical protein
MLLQLLCLLPLRRCRAITAHAAGGITAHIAAAAGCPYHPSLCHGCCACHR